ncbi:MAG: hypothetical protein ABFS56_22740 [Pseudomonadota bacterium]
MAENETYISIHYDNSYVKTNLILRKDFNLPDHNLLSEMKKDFKLKLRGKILFKVLSVYLNARKRAVKYKIHFMHRSDGAERRLMDSSNHLLYYYYIIRDEIKPYLMIKKSAPSMLRDKLF